MPHQQSTRPVLGFEAHTTSTKYISDDQLAPFISSTLPTSQVELTLSCRDLINTDIISKSDPFCIVLCKESWQDQYYEVMRTETISDNLNPQWVKKLVLNYNFETMQKLRFEVRDEDYQGSDFLGFFETTLSDLVSTAGRQYIGKLKGQIGGSSNQNLGEIIIVAEEVLGCKQIAQIKFRAEQLPKLGWVCSNDPFLVLSRSNEDSSWSVVARTEPCWATKNPIWNSFGIRVTTLCNADFDRTIKIDCYDHRSNGSHKLIGTCYSSLRNLIAQNEPMIFFNEEKRKANSSHANAGILKVDNIHFTEEITFLDYISRGTQLHFVVAIDFTASNGIHTDPNSLHYLSPNRMNSYEIALRGVGEIISKYDNLKLFPAFGFGAKLPPSGHISHQFPLNGNASHPYCSSIEEIMVHYRRQLNSVQLYGPTNFAPVINNMISISNQFQDGRNYFVLLIITDGIISDMQQTKRAIINASSLPISIIIVGVGNADFENMDELDGDNARLYADGRYAERDIVQFVPLNKFLTHGGPNQYIKSQTNLAKEVLAEVPEQLTSFMKSKGIKPQASEAQNTPPNVSVVQPTAPLF
ncbi:copine-8-like [Contarinia nasturtii]|uniref:copine-8-like n=1 Tax=Contarinia nasturtii TaxID=265458 RepID=UPI0012D4C45F|nr:copine-8-like [Contarinia nasturtii]